MVIKIKVTCPDNLLDAIEELAYALEQARIYVATKGTLKTRLFSKNGDSIGTVEVKK